MKGVQIYPAIGKTRLLGEADERVDLGLGWGRYFSQMILRNFLILLSRNFPTRKFTILKTFTEKIQEQIYFKKDIGSDQVLNIILALFKICTANLLRI